MYFRIEQVVGTIDLSVNGTKRLTVDSVNQYRYLLTAGNIQIAPGRAQPYPARMTLAGVRD